MEFCRFVDRVLSQHKNLNSLRRSRCHFVVESEYEVWPNFLLRTGLASDESQLEEIDCKLEVNGCILSDFPMGWLPVPEALYSLKRLKVLKLHGFTIETSTKGTVLLPSLKILQLLRVEIMERDSLSTLISGCPVLETLRIENCYLEEGTIVTASLPSLKTLRICCSYESGNLFCPMRIEAPSLEHLYLSKFVGLQFLGTSAPLPYLHSAQVKLSVRDISLHESIRLLAQISSAKEMWLSWGILSVLSNAYVQLPIFPNLTHLTIELHECNSSILHSLLKAASKLQYLSIDWDYDMEWTVSEEPASTPECLLSSLVEINVNNVRAVEDDMNMLSYLLKAGAVPKKVNLLMLMMVLTANVLGHC